MAEKLLSVFFLIISSIYTYYAANLSFGNFTEPKAGFLPMLAGSIAILLSSALVIRSLAGQCPVKTSAISWRKLAFIVIGLTTYIILLTLVGYLAATSIIMLFLLKMTDTQNWLVPGLLSAGIATSFYFIFERFLGSKLP